MNQNTTHSETGNGNHSLADFTISRLQEALEIANKSADDQMFQKLEAENEVARLRELLNRALECLKVYGGFLGVEAARQISEELAPTPEEPAKPACHNTTHKFSHCDCKQPSEKDTSTETCPSQKDTQS